MPAELFSNVELIMMIFLRIVGFFVVAPFFSGKYMNRYVRLSLSFILAYVVFNTIPSLEVPVSVFDSAIVFGFYAIKELGIGLAIGFATSIIFNAIVLAGSLIDGQAGLTMSAMYDPTSATQMPITANLYYYVLIVIALLTNMHYGFIRGIVSSYASIPICTDIVIDDSIVVLVCNLISEFFLLAFKFASPIIAVMLILDVGLGILVRTVPQMNVFVVGFPLKIAIYLFTMTAVTALFIENYDILIDYTMDSLVSIIKVLTGNV